MNYTIMTIKDVQGDLIVCLDKSGNKYVVVIRNNETEELSSRTFDNLNDAIKKMQIYTELIGKSLYSESDKRKMLEY